jgi:glycosyltransferase involved in cell wall biosynthesis
LNIKIITQNFPPRIGGIQNVMYSLAKNFSNLGFNVHVMPDHFYSEPQNFKITNFYFPKILRPFTKRIYLSFLKSTDELVFCDTWKSVKSIPQKYKNIVVFAHGQEFLNK